MKKNDYKKPTMRVVELQQRQHLLIESGGGQTRENSDCWDDSEEW